MSELIDISEDLPQFNHREWIGTGRRLPDDPDKITIGFRLFCDTLLKVPEEFKASLYPDPKLSAEQFLDVALPQQSHHIVVC